MLKSILIALVIVSIFYTCKKPSDYPIVPVISFKEFVKYQDVYGKDSIGVLSFEFTDGDGDIGLKESDTISPYNPGSMYYYNFFVDYYEKQNGELILVPTYNNSRIPYITPEGKNKALKGEIDMELFINNYLSPYDTIVFQAYIVDRALNKSNIITTPEIIVTK